MTLRAALAETLATVAAGEQTNFISIIPEHTLFHGQTLYEEELD